METFETTPKECTPIPMNMEEGQIEKILNVSPERMASMQKQVSEVMSHPEDYKIVVQKPEGRCIDGPVLLDILANKIATTDAERVVLLIQFKPMTQKLKQMYMKDPLESLLDLLRNH
jgi:hypothetical protein